MRYLFLTKQEHGIVWISSNLEEFYTINDILITSTNDKWIYVPRNTPKLVMIPNSESLDEVPRMSLLHLLYTDGKELLLVIIHA